MAINIIGGGGGGISVELDPTALKSANNLSDVPNKPTARNNLGLGSIATYSSGQFQQTPAVVYGAPFPYQSQFVHALKGNQWVPIASNQTIFYYDYTAAVPVNETYSYYGYDATGSWTELLNGTTQVGSTDVLAYKADGDFTGNITSDTTTVYEAGTGPTYGNGWGDSYIAYADEYDSAGSQIGYIYVFHNGSGGFDYQQNVNNPPF